MVGGFVICEYEKVKQEFPEFQAVLTALRSKLIAKAVKDWGLTFAGGRKIAEAAARGVTLTAPGPGLDVDVERGEFGETTILPALFNDITGTRMVTWNQWFDATGSQMIMTGAATGHRIYRDYKVGVAGLVFLDKAIRISEIKMQISDKKLPRINIEEAFGFNKPALCLEEGYVLDENYAFELFANVLTQGPQRIKLLGLQVNKIKDKLLTPTGSAVE